MGQGIVIGLREEEAATNTIEVDKLQALLSHVEGCAGVSDDVSSSIHAGLISELRFKVEALERGFEVYQPCSPASKADFIIRKSPHRPLLIQVKRAGLTPSGGWRFATCSRNPTRGTVPYRFDEFDFFAVHVDAGVGHYFGFFPLSLLHGNTNKVWQPSRGAPPPDNWDILEESEGVEE